MLKRSRSRDSPSSARSIASRSQCSRSRWPRTRRYGPPVASV